PLDVVPEAEPIAIAILDVEVAVAIRLIAQVPRDRHALGLELLIERIRILDPDVCVPGVAILHGEAVGTHHARRLELTQHDEDSVAFHHAEGRWLAPEAIVLEAELVAIEVRGRHDVVDDEVRRDAPAVRHCRIAYTTVGRQDRLFASEPSAPGRPT